MRPSVVEGSAITLAAPAPSILPSRPEAARPEGASFARVLGALGAEVRRGEALVERAARGGGGAGLSPAELLALQAGIYRWVEVVDLASKLVDRATQAAKTITQPGNG